MLIFDTTVGEEVGSFEIVADTDNLFYDASRSRQRAPTFTQLEPMTDSQWQANLRILDVKAIKTVPYVPLSHPSG